MESDANKENAPIVSTGEWVASKFLLLIPVVNIIFLPGTKYKPDGADCKARCQRHRNGYGS